MVRSLGLGQGGQEGILRQRCALSPWYIRSARAGAETHSCGCEDTRKMGVLKMQKADVAPVVHDALMPGLDPFSSTASVLSLVGPRWLVESWLPERETWRKFLASTLGLGWTGDRSLSPSQVSKFRGLRSRGAVAARRPGPLSEVAPSFLGSQGRDIGQRSGAAEAQCGLRKGNLLPKAPLLLGC